MIVIDFLLSNTIELVLLSTLYMFNGIFKRGDSYVGKLKKTVCLRRIV